MHFILLHECKYCRDEMGFYVHETVYCLIHTIKKLAIVAYFNLNQFDIATRAFSDWTMGFETLDTVEFANLPGGFDLDEDFFQKEPIEYAPVLDTLKSFYNLNKTFGK